MHQQRPDQAAGERDSKWLQKLHKLIVFRRAKEWVAQGDEEKHIAKHLFDKEEEKTELHHLEELERDSQGSFEHFEEYSKILNWETGQKWGEAEGELAFYASEFVRETS